MRCNLCSLCVPNQFTPIEPAGDKSKGAKIVMYKPTLTDYKSKVTNSKQNSHLTSLLRDYNMYSHTYITYAIKCFGITDGHIEETCIKGHLVEELANAKVVLLLGAEVSRSFFKNVYITDKPILKEANGIIYIICNFKGIEESIKLLRDIYKRFNPLV